MKLKVFAQVFSIAVSNFFDRSLLRINLENRDPSNFFFYKIEDLTFSAKEYFRVSDFRFDKNAKEKPSSDFNFFWQILHKSIQ